MKVRFLPLALLLAACFQSYDTPPSSMQVHRGTFVNEILLTGELEAARGAYVSVPQLPTWQTSIKWIAPDGTEVKAGDRLAELDNSTFAAELDDKRQTETQSRLELQQREAEWAADLRQKDLDVAKRRSELEKAKLEAAVPKEIVSAHEYEDRQTKLLRATVEHDKARRLLQAQQNAVAADRSNLLVKIDRAHRDVETSEKAIDALILRAPRDGIVVLRDHQFEPRKLQNGDAVWVGFPLAQIPELDSLQVSASLADVDDGRVQVGMPAVVTIDGYPSMRFPGRVTGIAAVAQEETRASMRRKFRVVVKLDRIDTARMRPGLSARVEVQRESKRGALIAPRAGIDFSAKQPRARLSSGKLVPVTLGGCNASECVVIKGLEEGARLRS